MEGRKSNESSLSSEEDDRGKWDRKTEYMLSMIGYCVGLGNLWRFPYLCMKNGGGAFLIPFLLVLLACGLPLYFLEVSLGQFTGRGNLHVWEVCPLFKGIGMAMMILLVIIGIYYNIIIAWILHYLGSSFFSPLPWTTCTNAWNTDNCVRMIEVVVGNESTPYSYSSINGTSSGHNLTEFAIGELNSTNSSTTRLVEYGTVSSEEEYWRNKVLQITTGIHHMGTINWPLLLCFLAAWVVMYACLWKGVRSVGKVVYVTATMPYILLLILFIRGMTLPGSADGLIFYLKPDFGKLLEIEVWIEAGLQVFYSLGPAWGPLITMASFNRFNNNCYRDAIILTLASEGTSIYAGLSVFAIVGFMAHKSGLPINEVTKSGPGLGFIAYPEGVSMLPLPQLWSVLFFFMLFTVGLDSQFSVVEAYSVAITDTFPKLRKRRALTTAVLCLLCFLTGLFLVTQGGMYYFQILDWYSSSLILPLIGVLECIIFGWIYGAEMFSRDIQMMLGRRVPTAMRIMWCFVTPALLLIMLVFTLATYKPPQYGDYTYPGYVHGVGMLIAVIPVIPIPVVAIKAIYNAKGDSLKTKILSTLRPSEQWLPVATDEQKGFRLTDRQYQCGFSDRVKQNILG